MIKVSLEDFRQDYLAFSAESRKVNQPIQLDVPEGMPSMYVVATQPGVNEVLKNENNYFVHFADYFASIPGKTEVDQKICDIFSSNLGNDDPIHNELRKDIRNHFNGASVDQHAQFIQKCTVELCERLEQKARANDGEVEFLEDFAKPLTFLITSHVTGLDFVDEDDKKARIEQADQAIRLVNLLASDEEKIKSLEAHDELADFIEKQLMGFVDSLEKTGRTDCLLYDLAKKVIESGEGRLRCYIEVVCGLFQAGLGATGNFLCLGLEFMINGDEVNRASDVRDYYFAPERTIDEKREAVLEMIRVTQKKLGGLLPRYAPAAAKLMGEDIQGNSLIYLNFVSANLDEQGFADPFRFNPTRSQIPEGLSKAEISERRALRKEKNLSFSYGEHMCPGRRIALVIMQIFFDEFFARFPNTEVLGFDVHTEIFGKPSEVLGLRLNLHI